ncbi:MAG: EutN/CcmL family microcompartment protein [Tissierellia bacterium]|nr:EutN/CcmL family microcompartment protein [Tissierellia bacterium]
MFLGTVVGNVVATQKDERLHGKKLLIVEPFDPRTKETKSPILAVDTVGAGNSETVILVRGSSARSSIDKNAPIDAAIVGIVDEIEIL